MNTFTTKFPLGATVYYVGNNQIHKAVIRDITILVHLPSGEIQQGASPQIDIEYKVHRVGAVASLRDEDMYTSAAEAADVMVKRCNLVYNAEEQKPQEQHEDRHQV